MRILVWIVPVLVLLLVYEPCRAAQQSTEEILSTIDSKFYVDGLVGSESGPRAVVHSVLMEDEIKFLIEHTSESIPAMLHRLATPKAIRYEYTKILYFAVFEKAKDIRTMLPLADYLDSLPDSEPSRHGRGIPTMEGEPFEYAFRAASAFLDFESTKKYSKADLMFPARHQIANQLRAEYRRRTAQEKQQ